MAQDRPTSAAAEPTSQRSSPVLPSPSVPRPIPRHSASSFSTYARPRGLSSTHSDTPTSSSNPSDTESSSPSSNANSTGLGASIPGGGGPAALGARRRAASPASPVPTRRSLSGVFPIDGVDKAVDHRQETGSPTALQSLEQLVAQTSLHSPTAGPIASSSSTAATLLPSPTSASAIPLSIAPPKRSFAATPSFPSPLARASIVPRDDHDDEEDTDVEPRSLLDTVGLGQDGQGGPSSGALDSAATEGMRAARRRRASSSLLRSNSRTSSPNAMLFLPEKPNSPSPPQGGSSEAGSSGSAGELNALGLVGRDSRRSRQTSDTTSFKSGSYTSEVGGGSGSVSTSPNRSRRRSEYLIPGQDVRKLSSNYPIPVMPRPIPLSSSPIFAPMSQVSPLNALPTPWGANSASSTSSSPTESSSAGIRLQRVPTAVRLAADMLSSSPAPSAPISAGGRITSPKPDFFLGTQPPPRPPLPSPTDEGGSSHSLTLSDLPHTPSATPQTSPEPVNLPLAAPAPHSTPVGDAARTQQSYLTASISMPSTTSRSAPKSYGHGHSGSRARPSLPPPSAYDALLFPPPSSAESPMNLHQRYRTSIHESSLAQSVGRTQGRPEMEGFASTSTAGNHDPDEYARYIMSTRSAKMQKWRRNSQVSLNSGPATEAPTPTGPPPLAWTPTDVSGLDTGLDHTQIVAEGDLTRSRTLPIGEGAKAPGTPAGKAAAAVVKDRASLVGTGTNNIEWVDWLDEYKQYKEAKIRAEFEGFTMPTKPQPAYQGLGHLAPTSSEPSGSGSVFSESPPIESNMQSGSFTRPIATRLPSDADPLAISPQTSRVEDNSSHRRSLSIRSLQAHELAKSSTHRLTTFFERPRNASTSTNRSTTSFAEGLPKGKKHLGSKIEGWWKSVKSNFASEPSTPRTAKHGSASSRQSPAAAGPSSSSQAQSSRISLHTALPSSVKRSDPSAPTSPTVVGFFPSNAVKTSPPVASLRNVTSAFDLKSGRSLGSPTAPQHGSHPSARPRAISQQIDFDRQPAQGEGEMSHSFASNSSGGQSDETMSRKPSLPGQTLETRRNQPRLSLKLERPSLDIPESSTGASTAEGSSVSSTDRPGPLRPTGMGPSSRHSSGLTDPDGPNNYLRPGAKPPQWAQTPSPLYAVLPDDPQDNSAAGSRKPSASATTYPAFNAAAMHHEIRQRLTTQKEVCNKELKKIIHLITLFVEDQLREVEHNRTEAMEHEAYASAMDSASDFGGDESDRELPPPNRRVSRTHSRRTSISNGSPVKRQQALPRLPPGVTSPSRRRSNANPPLRSAQQTELRLAARKLSASVAHTSSNSSSRSTSRSRSPLPPGTGYLSPDGFSADGKEMPNVFILTLQEIIGIATEILDMSISQLTAKPGRCPEFVQKVQQVGTAWDDHPDWPGRGWYVQLLLAVAGLSRVVEWWEAEKGFWNFAQDEQEDVEPLHFVLKDAKVISPVQSPTKPTPPTIASLGLGFGFDPSSSGSQPQFSSIGIRLDEADPPQQDGERTATLPKVEVQDTTEDLRDKVEQAKNLNMVLELSLDGEFVEWINPAWREVVGSNPADILGQPIQEHLAPADGSVFAEATRELLKDDSHTVEARFRLQILPDVSDDEEEREPGPVYLEMDGSGMLMRDRFTGEASHTMWVIKPVSAPSGELETPEMNDEPQTAGLGLGFYRRPATQPVSPFPHGRSISIVNVLCRICERQVPAWYFEKHNETCHELHRLEADLSERNETVSDLLRQATELLDAIDESTPAAPARYKDTPIFTLPSFALPAEGVMSPSKPQQIVVRTMQRAVVNQVVSVLQTALDISTPSIKEDAPDIPVEQQRLLSPRSEEYLTLANTWSKPTTEDPALGLLIQDTSTAVRNKINAVNRMRNTVVYSERVRHEWEDKVEKTLAALSEESSSDSGSSTDSHSDEGETEEQADPPNDGSPGPSASEDRRLSDSPVPLSVTTSATPLDSSIVSLASESPTLESTASSRPTTGLMASASITSNSSAPSSSRPRRFSRQPSSDRVRLSTPPMSPPLADVERSPVRQRKASISGRASFGSEGPLSPRIPSTAPASRSTTISIKDFDILKPISKGAFGSVFLAKKNTTGDYYAIKVLKKADMISKNQITNVKAERKILMNQAESPYVVRLFFTFQNKHNLFLVMEYLPGGDVGALVKKLGTLDEDWTRSYIAEVVLGLESLHDKGVVHRDLKPDNLLIDAKGHLKLTDFGLSRIGLLGRQAGGSRFTQPRGKSSRPSHRPASSRNQSMDSSTDSPLFAPQSLPGFSQSYFNRLTEPDGRTGAGSADESSGSESVSGIFTKATRAAAPVSGDASFASSAAPGANPSPDSGTPPVPETHKFVGTVDYVAPESILGLGGDDAGVDWWALGVVMYELLYGCPPFNDETPEKVFDNIISRRIHWPENDEDLEISAEARDLMERLMCTNPATRLGARGTDEIKRHPFFASVDWDTVFTAEASFVPMVSEEISTDYFDARGLMELPEELDAGSAVPEPIGDSPSSASVDDFGTFNFRNLSASKAANDQVVMDMRAQALAAAMQAQPFEAPPPVVNLHERRRSIDIRKRSRAPLILHDPKSFLVNPPSPATSSSSGTSSNLPGGLVWQTHSRRTSELDRIHAESDIARRSSLPSRLRAGSTSHGSSEPSPLAFSPASSVSSPTTVEPASSGGTPGHAKVQVLLAEDNPVSSKVAYGILTKLGIECATVSNGSDALAVATSCPFDVLFLDLRLPHLDADHIARYLKSVSGPNFETPIVAVTGLSEDDSTVSETGTLFSAVISKPITKETMLAVLLKLGFKVESLAASAAA